MTSCTATPAKVRKIPPKFPGSRMLSQITVSGMLSVVTNVSVLGFLKMPKMQLYSDKDQSEENLLRLTHYSRGGG